MAPVNASIQVRNVSPHTYEVTVCGAIGRLANAAHTTVHRVRAAPLYVAKLARRGESAEGLIGRAFEFLLAREPNTSILAEFDLSTINRYFPDFERIITSDSSV
jgi:hypothetical protein